MKDSGIVDANNCIFMNPGPGSQWWLSPDVIMEGADPSTANPGPDVTDVTVHWKSECTLSGGTSAVLFELYVGDPSLAMSTANTVELTAGALPVTGLTSGASKTMNVSWTPDADPSKPNGPGHRCLIARCYPVDVGGSTPDPLKLSDYLPDDPHYAQHNLTVLGAGGKEPRKKQQIGTGNPFDRPEEVVIHAIADIKPSRELIAAILPSLKAFPGFKQIATTPLRKIGFDFGKFGGVKKGIGDLFREVVRIADEVEDKVERIVTGEVEIEDQEIRARVQIAPKFFSKFDFIVDATGTTPGDAHIYHLTQTNAKGQPSGGLTVVVVSV